MKKEQYMRAKRDRVAHMHQLAFTYSYPRHYFLLSVRLRYLGMEKGGPKSKESVALRVVFDKCVLLAEEALVDTCHSKKIDEMEPKARLGNILAIADWTERNERVVSP